MEEKDLIKKIKSLKNIQPDKDWILACKTNIMGKDEPSEFGFFNFDLRKAFVLPVFAILAIASVVFANPGNRQALYAYLTSFRKIDIQTSPEENNGAERYLVMAEEKIKQLKEIAKEESNEEELAAAIEETADLIRKAADSIPEKAEDPQTTSQYVAKISQIQAQKEEISQILGSDIDLGEKELEEKVLACLENSIEDAQSEKEKYVKEMVEAQIRDLKQNQGLSEEEKEILAKAEALYAEKQYSAALEALVLMAEGRQEGEE